MDVLTGRKLCPKNCNRNNRLQFFLISLSCSPYLNGYNIFQLQFDFFLYMWCVIHRREVILKTFSNRILHAPKVLKCPSLNQKQSQIYSRFMKLDRDGQKNRNDFGYGSFWHIFLLLVMIFFFFFLK